MITRQTVALSIVLLLAVRPAYAAPPFGPVPAGYSGTPFRGVALGQTREEVELALTAVGKRCMTDEELSPYKSNGTPGLDGKIYHFYIEDYDGYDTCRIVELNKPIKLAHSRSMAFLTVELTSGMPVYAVSFLDGRASALSLLPDYFNFQGADPMAFAQSIVDNYPVQTLDPTQFGWRGLTDKGELIQVLRGNATVPLWMIVFLATDTTTPTFD